MTNGEEETNAQLSQLLNETRNTLYGVQVLFAGMLAVPFSNRFGDLTDDQRNVYLVALLSAALASVCLITPAHYHRIACQGVPKDATLRIGRQFATGGSVLLTVAITLALSLVTDVVAGRTEAVVFGVVIALCTIGCWFVIPALARRRK